jgi:hypothetical protein
MPYVREWETATEALHRLKASGHTEAQAMRDICDAIADRAIPIRVHCADGNVYFDADVIVPTRFEPADLCWASSHVFKHWERRAAVVDLYFDHDLRIKVDLLELRRDAVTRVLLRGDTTSRMSGKGAVQMGNSFPITESSEGKNKLDGNGCEEALRNDAPKPKPTDQAVRQWMRDRVANWPADQKAPSEQTDWDAVQNYFSSGLTRGEFRAIRKEEAPAHWRKQGRRKAAISVICRKTANLPRQN